MYPGRGSAITRAVNGWSRENPGAMANASRSEKVRRLLDGADQGASGTFVVVVGPGEHPGAFPEDRLRTLDPRALGRRTFTTAILLVVAWALVLLTASAFWDVTGAHPGEPVRELDPTFYVVPVLALAPALVMSRELARWAPAWLTGGLFAGGIVWAVLIDPGSWSLPLALVAVAGSVMVPVSVARRQRIGWWRSVEPLLDNPVHTRARVVDIAKESESGGLAGNAVLVLEAPEMPGRQWFMVCHKGITGIREVDVRTGESIDLFYAARAPSVAVLRPVATGMSRPGTLRLLRDSLCLPRDVAGRAIRMPVAPDSSVQQTPEVPIASVAYPLVGYPTATHATAPGSPAVPTTPDARARGQLAEELSALTNPRTALTLILPVGDGEAPADIPRRLLAGLDPHHGWWRTGVTVVVLETLWMSAVVGAHHWWGAWGEGVRAGIDSSVVHWALAVLPWILGLRLLVWSSRFLGWVRAWPAHVVFAGSLVAWAVHEEWRFSGYWHFVAGLLLLTVVAFGSRRRRVAWARRAGSSRLDHVATVARIDDILWTSVDAPRTPDAVLVVASEHAPHGCWFVPRRTDARGVSAIRFAVGDPVVVLYRPTDPSVAILRPVPEHRGVPTSRRASARLRSTLRTFRDVTGSSTPARVPDAATVELPIIVPPRSGADRSVVGPGS